MPPLKGYYMENTQDITCWDISIMAIALIGAIACAYLAGEDAAMDEIDYAARLRVICAMPGHSETLCHNTAQGRTVRD